MEDIPGRFSFRRRPSNTPDRSDTKTINVQSEVTSTDFEIHTITNKHEQLAMAKKLDMLPWSNVLVRLTNNSINEEQYYLTETEHYSFPWYFQAFQNVVFVCCLQPFRISITSFQNSLRPEGYPSTESVKICRVFLQAVISALIHIIIFTKCLLKIGANLTIKLRLKSNKLFEVLESLAFGGLISAFIYTGWRKQQAFKSLNEHFKSSRKSVAGKSLAILIGISLIPLLQYVVTIYFKAVDFHDTSKLQDDLAQELWTMWIRNTSERKNNGTEYISDPVLKGFGYASMTIHYFLIWFVRISADILVFVAALSIREIAMKYRKLLQLPDLSLETMSNLYLKMEMQIEMINNCTGPIVLGWFTLASLFFLQSFFQMFSKSDAWMKGLNFVVILHNVVTILVAANAHNIALECKDFVIEKGKSIKSTDIAEHNGGIKQATQFYSPAFVAYLEMSEEYVGVRGSEFFVINNGFIGGVVSSLVTYLLIMLQFNLDLQKPSTNTAKA